MYVVMDLRCWCDGCGVGVFEDEVCVVGVLLYDWFGDVIFLRIVGVGEVVSMGGLGGVWGWCVWGWGGGCFVVGMVVGVDEEDDGDG